MQNNLKVLHVIPSVSSTRGGPSKAVIEMVSALQNIGIEAEIATTNDDSNNILNVPLNVKTQYKGVPVTFFQRFSPSINVIREFAYSNNFRKWLKKNIHNYDVIHIHAIFSFCSSYAMTLARKKRIPYIVRPIGQLEDWSLSQSKFRKQLYLNLVEKSNLENANAMHFTAQSEQQQALTFLPKLHAHIIPLGIQFSKKVENAKQKMLTRWSLKNDMMTLLFLSRLHHKKGLELLLNSLSKIKHKPFQLIIAGDGNKSYKQSLEGLINSYQLNTNCHFVGFVKDVEKEILLQGCDFFVLPSYSENFGIAVLEAMAASTPVIISDAVALASDVKENQLGFVCRPNEESLYKTLRQALDSNDAINEMGQAAQQFARQNYSWKQQAEKLNTLYKSII